ncbi:hypothetical protein VTO42DRAFT_8119 [Malbranchea cinnamomea]
MSTAIDGAYGRYGHIVTPSLWNRLLDLCLGRGLADRLHKARLERAYWETVAAHRATGDTVVLPGDYTEENFPGPKPAARTPMQDDAAGPGAADAAAKDGDKESFFEPSLLEQDAFALPPAHHLFRNSTLDATGPDAGPMACFSPWHTFDYGKRKRPIPHGSTDSWTSTAVATRQIYSGYGFNSQGNNAGISGLSKVFGLHQRETRNGPQAATVSTTTITTKNTTSPPSSSAHREESQFVSLSSNAKRKSTSRQSEPSAKKKKKAKEKDKESCGCDSNRYANDSGCAIASCSVFSGPPVQWLRLRWAI